MRNALSEVKNLIIIIISDYKANISSNKTFALTKGYHAVNVSMELSYHNKECTTGHHINTSGY